MVRERVVDLAILLPEHWWGIPLQPPDARARSIKELVESQLAGTERSSALRAELAHKFAEQARLAVAQGARLFALSTLRVVGVPVPASLIVTWIGVPPRSAPYEPGEQLAELQGETLAEAGPRTSVDLGRMHVGVVLRRVHEQVAVIEGAPSVPTLVADYWVERPDGWGLVQFAFATPMLMLREPLLELFDTVVGTIRWEHAS